MKQFLIIIVGSLLLLSSCKKDTNNYADLNISGFGAIAFASGDAISIYGSGFDPNTEANIVTFNGVRGDVAYATPNRLQVITPLLTTSGKITVQVRGKSVTSSQTYSIVNVLQGTYLNSFQLTADKKYLLRGKVVFKSKLSIQAGTVIYGENAHKGAYMPWILISQGPLRAPSSLHQTRPLVAGPPAIGQVYSLAMQLMKTI